MTDARAPFADRFRADANIFVQAYDSASDQALIAMMSEADYKAASFLDQRIMTQGRAAEWAAWDDLAAVSDGLRQDAQFIFHIGHVGSTLIARLLGELPGVLALREPLILRALAELARLKGRAESPWSPEQFCRRIGDALGWLSRTFRREQRAIVKATSFASDLAPAVLRPGTKALFLYVDPAIYMRTILAGENSVRELASLSASRLSRLHERIGAEPWRLWALSTGERAALAWACEMAALEDAANDDVLWVDFDAFLAAPADMLMRIAAHFGEPLEEAQAASLTGGPIMQRYSKAPEHGYSAELRRDVLAQAEREWAEELDRGARWIDAAGADHDLIGRALARAAAKRG